MASSRSSSASRSTLRSRQFDRARLLNTPLPVQSKNLNNAIIHGTNRLLLCKQDEGVYSHFWRRPIATTSTDQPGRRLSTPKGAQAVCRRMRSTFTTACRMKYAAGRTRRPLTSSPIGFQRRVLVCTALGIATRSADPIGRTPTFASRPGAQRGVYRSTTRSTG